MFFVDILEYIKMKIPAFLIILYTVFYSGSFAVAGSDTSPQNFAPQTATTDISGLGEVINGVGMQLSALPEIQEQLQSIRNSVYKSSKRLIHIRLLLILIFLALVINLWILTRHSSAQNKMMTESTTRKMLNNYAKNRQFFRLMLVTFVFISSSLLVAVFFFL